MPRHPVADNGGKLSDLKTDARIIQRRVTEKIFVEANLRALIRGIEMPIDAHLTKEIKMVRPLHVGEDRQSRVEEKSVVRVDLSAKAGEQNDRNVLIHLLDESRSLLAVHFRHRAVHHDEIEMPEPEFLERFAST